MIKILNIPQYSMYNDEGQVLLDSDSTCRVFINLLEYLKKSGIEYKISFLLPPKYIPGRFIKQCTEYGVHLYNFPFKNSPIDNRYNFNFDDWESYINDHDIIWNHIIEITRNIRSILKGKNKKIVSFFHIIDFLSENQLVSKWPNGDLYSYFWRQLDGELSSDISVFNSTGNLKGCEDDLRKLNFPYSNTERTYLSYFFPERSKFIPNKKYKEFTTVFCNRITSSMYTNWHKAIKLFKDPYTKGRIFFSNPSNSRGINALIKEFDIVNDVWEEQQTREFGRCLVWNEKIYISLDDIKYNNFLDICSKSHASLSLFEIEYYGGIAHREAIQAGKLIPIQPYVHEFKNWFKDFDYIDKACYLFTNSNNLSPIVFNDYIENIKYEDISMAKETLDYTLENFEKICKL